MNDNDRRVRRTKQLLGEALVALILEKGYDDITIKAVTERADVAHATFYRHYKDKDELLAQRLQSVIAEIEAFTNEVSLSDAEGYLIFKHAQENKVLYRILLGSRGTTHVRKAIRKALAANFAKSCQPLVKSQNRTIPLSLAANHMAAALLAMIEWWLEEDIPYPASVMATIYEQLVIGATVSAATEGSSGRRENRPV